MRSLQKTITKTHFSIYHLETTDIGILANKFIVLGNDITSDKAAVLCIVIKLINTIFLYIERGTSSRIVRDILKKVTNNTKSSMFCKRAVDGLSTTVYSACILDQRT